eukprot:g4401.t1
MRNSLTKIVDSMMRLDRFNTFRDKVNGKTFPSYYQVVKRPMWLNKIRSNVREKRYKSKDEFLGDVKLLVTNSALFNGQMHVITAAAQNIYADAKRLCDIEAESFKDWEDKIATEEKREFRKKNSFKRVGAFGGKGYVQGFDRSKKEEKRSSEISTKRPEKISGSSEIPTKTTEISEPSEISSKTTEISEPLTLNVSEPPTLNVSEPPTPSFSEPPTPNFSEPPTPNFSVPPTPVESNLSSPSSAMLMDIDEFESEEDGDE